MTTNSYIEEAMVHARNALRRKIDPESGVLANLDEIERASKLAVDLCKGMADEEISLDVSEIIHRLREEFTITQDSYVILQDEGKDHEVWWPEKKLEKGRLPYWSRYKEFISPDIPFNVVNRTDRTTDTILGLLEDPERHGSWDRRGLVVGQVQMGKTSNYTGLICKAVDAGYKLIVVLAGIHKSLRAQTQLRIDQGFLGFNTSMNLTLKNISSRIGASKYGDVPQQSMSLTTNADDGDFKQTRAQNAGIPLGELPTILVVKKNKSVLTNLINWAVNVKAKKRDGDNAYIDDVPFLLIDDEADNASVNAKKDEVAAINGKIRDLLNLFTKKAYVGYTATPFANVFIDPEEEHSLFGPDIYPESFIINLKAPSNYFGPTRVFGIKNDSFSDLQEQEPLPVRRFINRQNLEDHFPPKHKKTLKVNGLPEDLIESMLDFYLSIAGRRARGQIKVHNSMLVHVTRLTDVQNQVKDLLQELADDHRRLIEYHDKAFLERLQRKWEEDFVPTTKKMRSEFGVEALKWDEIARELPKAIAGIMPVKAVNGSANDILDYENHPSGISVISVGGEKLSRGLTLEGLTVSYFARPATMYDTLMQMGRWFGFRDGYADLCRLYITQRISNCFTHVTLASEELRKQFDEMGATGGYSPKDYGNAIRTSPEGMLITSSGKMRSTRKMILRFSDKLVELPYFSRSKTIIESNFIHTDRWLKNLPDTPVPRKHPSVRGHVWKANWNDVTEYLSEYDCPPQAWRKDGKLLSKYIKAQVSRGILENWVVALMDPSEVDERYKGTIGKLNDIGMFYRGDALSEEPKEPYSLPRGRLGSGPDEAIGLNDDQWQKALELTQIDLGRKCVRPSVRHSRNMRGNNGGTGLLMLYLLNPPEGAVQGSLPPVGYAVSIPLLDGDPGVEYRVNKDYYRTEFNFQEEENEDDD